MGEERPHNKERESVSRDRHLFDLAASVEAIGPMLYLKTSATASGINRTRARPHDQLVTPMHSLHPSA
jgi:hypothetical protein